MNPRAAINDLLPFQGSPFSHLGISPKASIIPFKNGEGGIRTHAPFRTNGFQDRLVMTTSIPLHIQLPVTRTGIILSLLFFCVNHFFHFILYFINMASNLLFYPKNITINCHYKCKLIHTLGKCQSIYFTLKPYIILMTSITLIIFMRILT